MSLYKNLLIFRRTEETPFLIHFTNEFFRREIDFEWLWTASTKTRNTACWSLQVANMHLICIVYVQCKPPITATKCPKYWMLISSLEFQKNDSGESIMKTGHVKKAVFKFVLHYWKDFSRIKWNSYRLQHESAWTR